MTSLHDLMGGSGLAHSPSFMRGHQGGGADASNQPLHDIEFDSREISFVCDSLEAYFDDNAGFDPQLYRSCKGLLDLYEEDVNLYKIEDAEHTRLQLQERVHQGTPQKELGWQKWLYLTLEEPKSSKTALFIFVLLTLCVIVSCISVVVATLPAFNPLLHREIAVVWTSIDWVVTSIFTIETGLRLFLHISDNTVPISKTRKAVRFCKNPYNVVDIVSLIPTYVQYFVADTSRIITGQLRTVRLLRIFRFLRKYKPIRMLLKGLWVSAFALIAPAACYVIFLFFLSSMEYFAENGKYFPEEHQFLVANSKCDSQPAFFQSARERVPQYYNQSTGLLYPWVQNNLTALGAFRENYTCPLLAANFSTIGQTCWFGVATFSTNGFGDFVPVTHLGKAVACCMLSIGLMIAAMPFAVVDASYVQVLRRERDRSESMRETTALRNAEASSQALLSSIARGEGHRSPGEALLLTFWSLANIDVLDLRMPLNRHVLLLDLLLESSVKQIVNADYELRQQRPPFAASACTRIPVWVATTTTNVPWSCTASTRMAAEEAKVRETTVLTQPYEQSLGAATSLAEGKGVTPAVFSAPLLTKLEKYRLETVQNAVKGTSTAFAAAVGETRHPPLKIHVNQMHATITIFMSWGHQRALLQCRAGCVVKVYRTRRASFSGEGGFDPNRSMTGSTAYSNVVDMERVNPSHFVSDYNIGNKTSQSQSNRNIANRLLLQLRERVDKNFTGQRSGKNVARGNKNNAAADTEQGHAEDGEPSSSSGGGGGGGPAPAAYVDDLDRYQLLREAQSAADGMQVDTAYDYAAANDVLRSEGGYFHLHDGDIVQLGGAAASDYRSMIGKVVSNDRSGEGADAAALVELAIRVHDAIFYVFRAPQQS